MDRLLPLFLVLICAPRVGALEPPDSEVVAALQSAQPLVGPWRGVGQPQRGSTAGAWVETGAWEWDFSGAVPALAAKFDEAKFIRAFRLLPAAQSGHYSLAVTLADGGQLDFDGESGKEQGWEFVAAKPVEGQPARISWRFVAKDARWVVLLEAQAPETKRYYRLAEIGYTRQGAAFAAADGQPECVVTGGHGSLTVEHAGQTYYVCCTGCRDLFESDPERILAEYRARQAAKKAKADPPD